MARYVRGYFKCPICGNKTWSGRNEYRPDDFVALKDSKMCRKCADELRVMYPATFERLETYSEVYYIEKSDISEITLKEFKDKINEVEAYRAQLRRKYNGYGKVFEILSGSETERLNSYKVGIPKMLKFKGTIKYSGRAILGTWKENDMAILIHEGKEFRAKVLKANADVWMKDNNELREGYLGEIILEKGTPLPSPGDLIVADE